MSALVITQRVEEAEEYCDRVAIIKNGEIVEWGTPGELKLRHLYSDCSSYFLKVALAENYNDG